MAVKERIQEQVRIYTEYDAQRRAEEIAGSMLANAVSKLEELTQNTVALMKSNDLLRTLERAGHRKKRVIPRWKRFTRILKPG